MLEKIHFSVITVVLDDLEGLKKTRNSLEKQRYRNWLHIVIDGGSRDDTKKFLESLPSKNTVYVSEKDTGIYNAMNKGWKLASPNSFVYFLNARDILATNLSLTKAAESLSQSVHAMWGCTTHEEINEDGSGWVCKLVAPPSIPNQLFAQGYRSHQAVVMRKELIYNLGGFDETYQIASDWHLIVRAMKHSNPVVWVHPLGRFELGGLSSKKILQAHIELRRIRRLFLVFTLKQKVLDEVWCAIYLHTMGYNNFFSRIFKYGLTKRKSNVSLPRFSGLKTQAIKNYLRFLRIFGLQLIPKSKRHSKHVHIWRHPVTVFYIRMIRFLDKQIRKNFNIGPLGPASQKSEIYPNDK